MVDDRSRGNKNKIYRYLSSFNDAILVIVSQSRSGRNEKIIEWLIFGRLAVSSQSTAQENNRNKTMGREGRKKKSTNHLTEARRCCWPDLDDVIERGIDQTGLGFSCRK